MAEHTGRSYEGKAHKYARKVDISPYNAYYERPAVVSLLLDVENANVLDAGCGSGRYAEYCENAEFAVRCECIFYLTAGRVRKPTWRKWRSNVNAVVIASCSITAKLVQSTKLTVLSS